MKSTISRLFAHQPWADQKTLASLRVAPSPRALEIFAHLLGAEHVWLSRLTGETPQFAVWPALDLAACESLAQANQAGYERFLAELSAREAEGAEGLRREVSYSNSAGVAFQSTVEDILLQVAMHGSYHRGQIALLLRREGAEPAATDFIGFARGVPAAPRR